MPPLSWRHHTLVQSLLARGPLKEGEFRSIFSQVTGKTSGSHQQLFNEYLRKINAELSYVQFEMRACRNQYDGDVYYGVINNTADEQSKLGTKYSVPQIAFYKGIIEAIIQDAEARGCILNTEALNIRLDTQVNGGSSQVPPAFKNFSMSQKEKTLEQLIKDQWLCTIPVGKIGIGVRSFLDLRSWFRTNEVPACEACNEAAVKAELCENEACNVRLHTYCQDNKFARQRVQRVCPGCGTRWPGSSVKPESEQEVESPNPQPREASTKKRRSSQREADAATQEDVDEKIPPVRRKHSSQQEANNGMSQPHSSVTSMTSMSDKKRVIRRSTRLGAN